MLPLLLLVAGVAVDLPAPATVLIGVPFSAAPLLAAALWTFRGTVATAAVSTFAAMVLLLWANRLPVGEAMLRLTSIATVGLLAVVVNRVVERSDTRAASARYIAESVQLAVLPVPPGRVGDLTVAARYEAAHVGARVGGDLYGVQRTPYGVRMLVGDVRGSGLGSITVVTVVLGAFREAAEAEPELSVVADRVERALERERARGVWNDDEGSREGFVTAVLVEVTEGGGPKEVRVVNRGHPPPLLLLPDGGPVRVLEQPDAYGLPLGLGTLTGGADGATVVAAFPPGALLLLHTDGLTEARDAEGAFYDPVPRMRGRRFPGPDALLDALLADVHAHAGSRQDDDMALLAVMRDPKPPSAGRSPSVSGDSPSA